MTPFVAVTDQRWFDYLSTQARGGVVDEVNFWQPRALQPMRRMSPGTPVFFKLKSPANCIAGYGFFASFHRMPVADAWSVFGWKNGDESPTSFLGRIGGYRGEDLSRSENAAGLFGCNLLRDAHFWPESRWIPFGEAQGWHRNIVQGRDETDPARVALLLSRIAGDAAAVPAELAPRFQLVATDGRRFDDRPVGLREGQGVFRVRTLEAYDRRCAISGERTEPVLDAAHIQPYLGPASNHVQNGIALTKEWHALYDAGLVAITPDYRVRVSRLIRDRWSNGRRYYERDGEPITEPREPANRPSPEALAWHLDRVFKAG